MSGTKLLREAHGTLYASLSHVRTEVNVGDLGDAKSGERFGQAREANLAVLGHGMTGFQQKSVDHRRAGEGYEAVAEKAAAGEVRMHLQKV